MFYGGAISEAYVTTYSPMKRGLKVVHWRDDHEKSLTLQPIPR